MPPPSTQSGNCAPYPHPRSFEVDIIGLAMARCSSTAARNRLRAHLGHDFDQSAHWCWRRGMASARRFHSRHGPPRIPALDPVHSISSIARMRIVIMGAGGLGGYFGARLAAAGNDVAFVARGAHLAAIRAARAAGRECARRSASARCRGDRRSGDAGAGGRGDDRGEAVGHRGRGRGGEAAGAAGHGGGVVPERRRQG